MNFYFHSGKKQQKPKQNDSVLPPPEVSSSFEELFAVWAAGLRTEGVLSGSQCKVVTCDIGLYKWNLALDFYQLMIKQYLVIWLPLFEVDLCWSVTEHAEPCDRCVYQSVVVGMLLCCWHMWLYVFLLTTAGMWCFEQPMQPHLLRIHLHCAGKSLIGSLQELKTLY